MVSGRVGFFFCTPYRLLTPVFKGLLGYKHTIAFDMSYVSSSSMIVNANRVQIHALAYNLFNWFRRLTLPESMRKDRIDTVRLKLLKIAARVVSSARYVYFKLCSYCPYQTQFFETLANIEKLTPQLE